MSKWTVDFVNDPSDDYNLVIELLYDGKDVGVIKHEKNDLVLFLYPHNMNISIPIDWLAGLINEAKKNE